MPTTDSAPDLDAFIARWHTSSTAERANYVLFLSELAAVLEMARPNPQPDDPAADAFVFEKPLPVPHGAVGRIDLYNRGCFLLEAKQGSDAPETQKPGGFKNPGFSTTSRKKGTTVRGTSTWDVAMEHAPPPGRDLRPQPAAAEVADGVARPS